MAPRKSAPTGPPTHHSSPTPESLSSAEPSVADRFICDCPEEVSRSEANSFLCRRCLRHQHTACATAVAARTYVRRPSDCNHCTMAVVRRDLEAREQKLREVKERLDQDIKKKEEEQRRQCEVVLWRQYCLLPNGNAPPAVVKATEMKFENVKMVPVHPAPQSWVNEVMKNVQDMETSGAEWDYEQPWLADSPDENERILRPWRELARWLIHHGPYKGRKSELGVLGEVLGLIGKGVFWKKWIVESE